MLLTTGITVDLLKSGKQNNLQHLKLNLRNNCHLHRTRKDINIGFFVQELHCKSLLWVDLIKYCNYYCYISGLSLLLLHFQAFLGSKQSSNFLGLGEAFIPRPPPPPVLDFAPYPIVLIYSFERNTCYLEQLGHKKFKYFFKERFCNSLYLNFNVDIFTKNFFSF